MQARSSARMVRKRILGQVRESSLPHQRESQCTHANGQRSGSSCAGPAESGHGQLPGTVGSEACNYRVAEKQPAADFQDSMGLHHQGVILDLFTNFLLDFH